MPRRNVARARGGADYSDLWRWSFPAAGNGVVNRDAMRTDAIRRGQSTRVQLSFTLQRLAFDLSFLNTGFTL